MEGFFVSFTGKGKEKYSFVQYIKTVVMEAGQSIKSSLETWNLFFVS